MNINYSIERLAEDRLSRIHITNQLIKIKQSYHIYGQNLVELGCGSGSNLEIFADDNKVLGVEGLNEAVDFIKNNLNIDAVQANLEEPLNFISDNTFEWIVCLDVLEHLVNPFSLMKEINRILVPGGRAIINVPNHFEIRGRIKILFGSNVDVHNFFPEYEEWNNPHIRFFTHKGISKMFQESEFNVSEDLSYCFSTLPLLQKIKLPGFGWLNEKIVKISPSLFSGGLFFIVQKMKEPN
jgi:methionine biosynthesis protein MetW